MQYALLILVAYLCGSIPFGKIYGYAFKGIDIQKHGTGNIGFANACRVLGWKIGVLVLVSDVAKGFVPLLLAQNFFHATETGLLLMSIAAVIGHAYPVWLKFHGGKSIAVGFGTLLVIMPQAALLSILTYGIVFLFFRRSAISSMTASWLLPVYVIILNPDLLAYAVLLAVFATYTHRANIRQMILDYAR